VNGVAECRPPVRWRQLTSLQTIRYRLKRVTRGNLRVASLVDVRSDALHGRDARAGARGFEVVEAKAIDRLERKLVLKARLGTGIELACRGDSALAIQVRAVTLEAQWSRGSRGLSGLSRSAEGMTCRFPLQSSPAGSTQGLRASAFQLSARKANPLVLCELTVFLCHGRQCNRGL
jgi:hypothetical protein